MGLGVKGLGFRKKVKGYAREFRGPLNVETLENPK